MIDSVFGGGDSTTTVVNSPNPPTAEEQELIRLQTDLSRRQLQQIDQLQPFQKQMLDFSVAELQRQSREAQALDAAITPEQRAAFQKEDFERTRRLGPIQDELLQLQLADIRRGGAATPEQEARIKAAADAGIRAGEADIDLATSRGIGLIADELANARGLRLSDSPISAEAALLSREGLAQKASLAKTMRAAEATSRLNFPLAASQITSGINLSTQNVTDAARQFQAELRQRAYQNRLALSGQTASSGIGLAGIGDPSRAISGLAGTRGSTRTMTAPSSGLDLGGLGGLMQGASMAWKTFSDRRLKSDVVKVADDPRGFGIYEYTIFGKRERGVMADEVAKVMPRAVSRHKTGHLMVDYRMLR